MLTSIRNFFSAPVFQDNDSKTRRARLLHVILLAQTFVLLFTLSTTIASTISDGVDRTSEFFVMVGGLFLILFWRFLMHRGMVSFASTGMTTFFIISVTAILISGGTIRSAGVMFYPLSVVMASLLINRRAGVIFFILTSIIGIAIIQMEIQGTLPPPSNVTTYSSSAIIIAAMGLTLVLLNLATQSTDEALNLAIAKEREVRKLASTLEKRVIERTKSLAASSEVSRRLSTILDPNRLVFEVVEQIKNAFNYYHVHIYLKNETSGDLVLAGGTGEVGKILLTRGHKISQGKGLVGRAAETNALILVSDTTADPNWLPNELLPDTKSEIAVPIALGSEVLGVLDVQQKVVNGLKQEDADLLQTISYQVAVALRNAQTYSQTQQVAERETLINEISRKIQNTATIEQALQVTVRELGSALGAKDSRVVLSLPENS